MDNEKGSDTEQLRFLLKALIPYGHLPDGRTLIQAASALQGSVDQGRQTEGSPFLKQVVQNLLGRFAELTKEVGEPEGGSAGVYMTY